MAWVVETLNSKVDEEVDALPADMRAKFVWISAFMESVGLPNVREPYVKHLQGELWEMRGKFPQRYQMRPLIFINRWINKVFHGFRAPQFYPRLSRQFWQVMFLTCEAARSQ